MKRTLLVIGARKGSLGSHIWQYLASITPRPDWVNATTAGISGDERMDMDITHHSSLVHLFQTPYTDVVCTVGVNDPEAGFEWHMEHNAIGPLNAVEAWAMGWMERHRPSDTPINFVLISSNSAHIARSPSAPYCASKAALSMGVRCLGRKYSRDTEGGIRIWGYEPGYLAGTPMSARTDEPDWDAWGDPHRIPAGGPGMSPRLLGRRIAEDVLYYGEMMQATMQRIDMGDQ